MSHPDAQRLEAVEAVSTGLDLRVGVFHFIECNPIMLPSVS